MVSYIVYKNDTEKTYHLYLSFIIVFTHQVVQPPLSPFYHCSSLYLSFASINNPPRPTLHPILQPEVLVVSNAPRSTSMPFCWQHVTLSEYFIRHKHDPTGAQRATFFRLFCPVLSIFLSDVAFA